MPPRRPDELGQAISLGCVQRFHGTISVSTLLARPASYPSSSVAGCHVLGAARRCSAPSKATETTGVALRGLGFSAPSKNRTCDLGFRKALLYPTELRGRRAEHCTRSSAVQGGPESPEPTGLLRLPRRAARRAGRCSDAAGSVGVEARGSTAPAPVRASTCTASTSFAFPKTRPTAGSPQRGSCGIFQRSWEPSPRASSISRAC